MTDFGNRRILAQPRSAGGLIEGPGWFHRRPPDIADRILRARGRSGRACRLPPPSRPTTSMSRDRRAHQPCRHSLGLKLAFLIDKSGLMWHTIVIMAFPLRPS